MSVQQAVDSAGSYRRVDPSTLTRTERGELTEQLLTAAHAADEPERSELLDEVVLLNRGVAEAIASRYRNRGVPQEDLEQAAFEGLIKAVQRFDPSVRPNLLTYAVPTIRGEVQRWFRDQSWMVRPPRRIQEMQWRISRSIESLHQELGHDPTSAQVAEDVGSTTEEVEEAIGSFGCFQPPSLDRQVTESGLTLGDSLADTAREGTDASDARLVLEPVMRRLPERDRRILYLRFFEDQSQAQIGDELGVTQMQVSRLLARILGDMRAVMA